MTLLLIAQSCKKEPSSIGLNLINRDLGAAFTDTTTLISYSVLEDSLNTTNLVFNFLGYVKDPVFGTSHAGIYTQFVPAANSVNFGDAPELDSIVLTLRYTGGFAGDTLDSFIIKVYELTESILSSKAYYQNDSITHNGNNITFLSYFRLYPTPTTRVRLDTILEPHIRIRLDNDLGERFLRNASRMETAEDFKNFFKGLYICAEPFQNNGSLVNFTLTSTLSGIQLYYKNGGESRRFSFTIKNEDAVRFNTYRHNHGIGKDEFVDQVVRKDTLLGEKKLYVQAMGGVKTKITFPYLKTLKDKRMVINKAELIITNIGEDLHSYPPPVRLGVYGVNAVGTNIFVRDDGTTYFGGSYDAQKKEYRFRITRHVQDIILRDLQPSIYLVVAGAAANANRLIFNGTHPTDETSRLKLEIYYTEY